MEFGVLMPHFGEFSDPRKLLDSARKLEDLGFDSLWVRDHLIFKPHQFEGRDRTFIDGIVTLSALAGVTRTIKLGTAVLIPIRWPLKVAQELACLSYISGGRVEAGLGLGGNPTELGAAGFKVDDRVQIFEETVQICRRIWAEDNVSFKGETFSFEDVTIRPKPVNPIPLWYGGTTRASVRRAVDYCDGWLPGRLPMATLDDRLQYLKEKSAEKGRKILTGAIPIFNVDRDRKNAQSGLDVHYLAGSSEGSKFWVKPPSGEFRALEDLEGLVIAGSPEDCILEIKKFDERGIDLFVFDLRLWFEGFDSKMELIAREVLPYVR